MMPPPGHPAHPEMLGARGGPWGLGTSGNNYSSPASTPLPEISPEERSRHAATVTDTVAAFVAKSAGRPTMPVRDKTGRTKVVKHLRYADSFDREGPSLGDGWMIATPTSQKVVVHTDTSRAQKDTEASLHLVVTRDGRIFQVDGPCDCFPAWSELSATPEALSFHYYGHRRDLSQAVDQFTKDVERALATDPATPRRVTRREHKKMIRELDAMILSGRRTGRNGPPKIG